MQWLNAYLEGKWLSWALAFIVGMAFERFFVVDAADDAFVFAVMLGLLVMVMALQWYNDRTE